MALINCPECKAEVSDKAKACPKCGNPLRSGKLSGKTIGMAFCLIVLAVGGWYFYQNVIKEKPPMPIEIKYVGGDEKDSLVEFRNASGQSLSIGVSVASYSIFSQSKNIRVDLIPHATSEATLLVAPGDIITVSNKDYATLRVKVPKLPY